MRKSVIAGIAAVVGGLIVLGVFLLRHEETRPPPGLGLDVGREARPAAPPTPDATAKAPPEEAPAPRIKPVLVVETDADADAASRPVAASDGSSIRVLIVDDATGFPVAGADVAWGDSRPDPIQTGSFGSMPPPPLITDFEGAPNHTTADGHGVAIVQWTERLSVAARHGDLLGYRAFTTMPRREVRIALKRGPFIAARVVDAGGLPLAGVPVSFGFIASRGKSSTSSMRRAVSRSPDGLAVAHHPALRPEDFEGNFELEAGIEGTPRKSYVRASLEKFKEGPITLVAPAHGSLVVKVLDPAGLPLSRPAQVQLVGTSAPRERTLQFSARANAGLAEFPFVPAGERHAITAIADGYDTIRGQPIAETLGPGAQLTVEVRFRKKRASIKGRAVDESGVPLSRRGLELDAIGPEGGFLFPASLHLETDASGAFSFTLDRDSSKTCDLQLEIRNGPDSIERSGFVAGVAIPEGEETVLGDVRLSHPVPLASGIVVDEDEKPVEGAVVLTEGMRQTGRRMVVREGRPSWQSELRAKTDAAGKFEVPTPNARGTIVSFGVRAELDGYICTYAPANLKPGAKDLKLVMRAGGSVAGKLELPQPAPVRKLEVRITYGDVDLGSSKSTARFEDCVDSDGRFRVSGIHPGPVTVAVWIKGNKEPLVSIGGVNVPRLGATDDPRLAAIDLTEHPALGQ